LAGEGRIAMDVAVEMREDSAEKIAESS